MNVDELGDVNNSLHSMDQHLGEVLTRLPKDHPKRADCKALRNQVRGDVNILNTFLVELANLKYDLVMADMKKGLDALAEAKQDLSKTVTALDKATKVLDVVEKVLKLLAV